MTVSAVVRVRAGGVRLPGVDFWRRAPPLDQPDCTYQLRAIVDFEIGSEPKAHRSGDGGQESWSADDDRDLASLGVRDDFSVPCHDGQGEVPRRSDDQPVGWVTGHFAGKPG